MIYKTIEINEMTTIIIFKSDRHFSMFLLVDTRWVAFTSKTPRSSKTNSFEKLFN